MNKETLAQQAGEIVDHLCSFDGGRRVGGEGNRAATRFVKDEFEKAGWDTEATELSVVDWKSEGAELTSDQHRFEVFSSPYSLGCDVWGELVAVSSLSMLRQSYISGKIVLLHGGIASEQIMPKNFIFYNPEEHQNVIAALEAGKPLALVCATGRNPALAGGVYPFPLFEDGDFDIPSVYMKDTEGEKLLAFHGFTFNLTSRAERIPETAYNVVARQGANEPKRIVITAHIDAKPGTPGAIDNATGVAVLVLVSRLLKGHRSRHRVELVALNGEDYYAVPGQMRYLEQNRGKFGDVLLNINIDGAGYMEGPSGFSPMQLPPEQMSILEDVISRHPDIVKGQPWYQGDHSIFLQQGCPAVAVSSGWFIENMETQDITHTPKDNASIVNFNRVAECALGIVDFVRTV